MSTKPVPLVERRSIGSLAVSLVGLGCNQLGSRCDERESEAIVSRALDLGINFFDTAEEYGDGESERMLGLALRGRRDKAVVATKFAGNVGRSVPPGRASAREIVASLEGSLRRLGTDCVDLYQLHFPDPATPMDETLRTLADAVQAGKVREIGCCNLSGAEIDAAAAIAADAGLPMFASAQNRLNLLRQEALSDVLPACRRHGLAFIPFFPLAAGVLTGKYRRGVPPPRESRLGGPFVKASTAQRILSPETFDALERLEDLAHRHGRPVADLAIAWLAAQPGVATIIAGATRPEQVDANVRAGSWKLTAGQQEEAARIAHRTE